MYVVGMVGCEIEVLVENMMDGLVCGWLCENCNVMVVGGGVVGLLVWVYVMVSCKCGFVVELCE